MLLELGIIDLGLWIYAHMASFKVCVSGGRPDLVDASSKSGPASVVVEPFGNAP